MFGSKDGRVQASAASEASPVTRWPNHGAPRGSRWRLAIGLALTLCLCASVSASAATFPWYGGSLSADCWQTGANPTITGSGCDPGTSYALTGAITGDLNAGGSGDYCNAYNTAVHACANNGAQWSLGFTATAASCPQTPQQACGIHHFASLESQHDYPWAYWYSQPELNIAAQVQLTQAYNLNEDWSYVCPVLETPPPSDSYIEYCFDEWQGTWNQANLKWPTSSTPFVSEDSCALVSVNGSQTYGDQVDIPYTSTVAPFASTLGSTIAGLTSFGNTGFGAAITLSQLSAAVAADDSHCGRSFPDSPDALARYRLVGIEDGFEGYPSSPQDQVGGYKSNLAAWTSYGVYSAPTPGPWKGAVVASNSDRFVYFTGTDGQIHENGYNGSTWYSTVDVAAPVAAMSGSSPTTLVDNATGDHYVYFAGTDGQIHEDWYNGTGWYTYLDVTSSVPVRPGTSPAALIDTTTHDRYVYFVGTDGQIHENWYNGANWYTYLDVTSPVAVASGSSPAAVIDPVTGDRYVYFIGTDGQVHENFYNGTNWATYLDVTSKVTAAPDTSPAVLVDPTTGDRYVYFIGTDGQVHENFYSGLWGTYLDVTSSVPAAPGTSVTALLDPSTGDRYVYFIGTDGQVHENWYYGSGWATYLDVTSSVRAATNSSPVAVLDPATDDRYVYFIGTDGQVHENWYYGSGWATYLDVTSSVPAAAGTSP